MNAIAHEHLCGNVYVMVRKNGDRDAETIAAAAMAPAGRQYRRGRRWMPAVHRPSRHRRASELITGARRYGANGNVNASAGQEGSARRVTSKRS